MVTEISGSIHVKAECIGNCAGSKQGIEYLQFNLAREAIFTLCLGNFAGLLGCEGDAEVASGGKTLNIVCVSCRLVSTPTKSLYLFGMD